MTGRDGEVKIVTAHARVLGERELEIDQTVARAALTDERQQLVRGGIPVDLNGFVRGTEEVLVPFASVGGQECVGSDRRRGSAATAAAPAAPNFSTTT